MERNEIYKAYGTDYRNMTARLLRAAGLVGEADRKARLLGRDRENLRIGIKPNVLGQNPAEFGATTHTEVVAGILDVLQEAGFKQIRIMEGAWVGDNTQAAFDVCGYNTLAGEYEIPLVDTQKDGSYQADAGELQLRVCQCVADTDFLINVPVLKGHCQTHVTCALKNMKGLIPNSEKRRFHKLGLHRPIAYLNTVIRQDYIVVDHICGDPDYEEGGNPLVRNCVMAALDPVLVDAHAAELLDYRTDEIGYLTMASEMGVGSADLSKLRIIVTEGTEFEEVPQIHKIIQIRYGIEDLDSCSACYAMLIGALERLQDEELLNRLPGKLCIGQGYRGQTGDYGIGLCTKDFTHTVAGCPPSEDEIYTSLKKWIDEQEEI